MEGVNSIMSNIELSQEYENNRAYRFTGKYTHAKIATWKRGRYKNRTKHIN